MKRVLIMCSLGLLSLNVQAQDNDGSVAERLQGCAELDSGVARLDCYDALAVEVAAEGGEGRGRGREMVQERSERGRERAEEGRERAEEARQRAQQKREERGRGIRDDRDEREERGQSEDEDGKRYITIEERWQNSRGLWRFRTADGEEWAQVEADSQFPMETGTSYYIESGFFNSYTLSHDGTNRRLRIRPEN